MAASALMGRVKVLGACFYPSEMTGVDQVGEIAKMAPALQRLLFILLAIFVGASWQTDEQRRAAAMRHGRRRGRRQTTTRRLHFQ